MAIQPGTCYPPTIWGPVKLLGPEKNTTVGQVAGFHLGQRLVAYDDIKEFTATNQFHDQEIPILGPEKKARW